MSMEYEHDIIRQLELYQVQSTPYGLSAGLPDGITLHLKIRSKDQAGWGQIYLSHSCESCFNLIYWSHQLNKLKGKSLAACFLHLQEHQGVWQPEKWELAHQALLDYSNGTRQLRTPRETEMIDLAQAYYSTV